MNINIEAHAPSQMVLMGSLALVVLAVLGGTFAIPYLSFWAFYLAIIAYVVLALGVLLKA
jgi:hypothetical protein